MPHTDSIDSFDAPQPYVSDGGFTIAGAMLTTLIGMTVAVAVGLLAGVIGQYFYMVLIFPIAIGGAVAGAQVAAIGRSKIRNPIVCGFTGLISGAVAVIAMHSVDYIAFQQDVAETAARFAEEKASLADIVDPDIHNEFAMALAAYEADPLVNEMNQVDSFVDYMDWAAKQGVELSSGRGTQGSTNLGYTGTMIYWSVEALVIAGMCVFITRNRAAKPFCIHCENWMPEKEIVSLTCDAKDASKAIGSGNLDRLPTMFAPNKETSLSLFQCENCGESNPILQPNEVSYNNGSRCTKAMGRWVFPKGSEEHLQLMFVDGNASDAYAEKLLSQVDAIQNETKQSLQTESSPTPESQTQLD